MDSLSTISFMLILQVSQYEQRNTQRLITSAQEEDTWVKPYMVNSRGKYLGSANNIWVNLPYFVLARSGFLQSILFKLPFHHLLWGSEGKGEGDL